MPKIRRKDKLQKHVEVSDDDEELLDDGESIVSNSSEILTDNSEDIPMTSDDYEDKISSLIEALSEKNLKTRLEALKSLKSGMSKKFAYEFFSTRYVTLSDSLEKCLKKGKGEEAVLSCECVSLLLIQLSQSVEKEEVFNNLRPLLKVKANDPSLSLETRSACLETLGLSTFLAAEEQSLILEHMTLMQNLFSTDNKNQIQGPISSAVFSWCLLFTLLSQSSVKLLIERTLSIMRKLLTSNDMELRVTAGEAIALIFEMARFFDEDFEFDGVEELVEDLKKLSTESNKYRAKKDKKVQRASFRDILKGVEDQGFSSYTIKLNAMESLEIESWTQQIQYENICRTLASGMIIHLQENPLLRDIFELGEPLVTDPSFSLKGLKVDKSIYKSAFKERTKHRLKQRTKKSFNSIYQED